MNPQQNKVDPKNMILAVVLSMLIVFGWQYYYVAPQAKKAQQQAEIAKTEAANPSPATPALTAVKPHDEVIAATQRVKIETDQFSGSINLTGAAFDDLKLNKYREQYDPKSPAVTLLSPSGTANAYYVQQGLGVLPNDKTPVPDANTVWTAPQGAVLTLDKPLTLTWDNGAGLKFQRDISISEDYLFTVKQTVTNAGAAPVQLYPYARVQRQDTPVIAGYWVFFEGMLGVHNGTLAENKYAALKDAKDEAGKTSSVNNVIGGWLGFTDKYWATVVMPDRQTEVNTKYSYIGNAARDAYQVDYATSKPLIVSPGQTATYVDHVFAGAKIVQTINSIYAKYGFDKFDLMIDWGWFQPLTKGMFYLLSWAHSMVGNFGVAILLVTVLVKALVFPLANRSYASMSRMKKLKPEMDKIKAQYPDDRAKQQQETMELYKREKVSPLAGCLPMLVQIPVFFSLYKVILTTIELRHAPFFGWIHDLSAPDPTSLFNLFGLIPWSPPQMLMIGFWPLLMGFTMWLQMRLNPTPDDPVQASMFNWMPVMFTFMLGSFPVGLVIYWAWSNTLSVIQQSYIMKKNGAEVNLFGNIANSIPFLKKKPSAP
ncbi:MAG: membrane protein insertase YidC [Alphaproteobacteria bacterium]|nr:membrane protein insertase YidC [Alphaproteobacteria bacterium]